MRNRIVRLSLLVLVPLASQAAEGSWSLQGGIAAPVGPMKNDPLVGSRTTVAGFTLSGAYSLHVSDRDTLQFKAGTSSLTHGADGTFRSELPPYNVTFSSSWSIPELGVDWRRAWAGRRFFTEAGVALAFPKLSVTQKFPGGGGYTFGGTSDVRQSAKPDLRCGIGTHLSRRTFVELQFHDVFVEKSGADGFNIGTLTWVELTFGIRFGGPAKA